MQHRRLLLPITVALASGLASCALPQIDAMPRYGQLQLSGGLGISAPPVGVEADLGTMGLGDQEDAFGVRADFKWGITHLVVTGQQSSHEGTGQVTQTLTLGGITIPQNADVNSQMDLTFFNGLVLFDLLPGAFWEVSAGLGVELVEIDGRVEEISSGNLIVTNEIVPLPVLAVNAGVHFGSLEIAALLQGVTGEYDGSEVDFFDGDLFARWRFLGGSRHVRSSLVAGYRLIMLNAEYGDGSEDVKSDLDLSGPYIGIEVTL